MISGTFRVTWKGITLGDHAYVTTSYSGNTEVRVIPRAKGVLIHSTAEMGGGVLNISIKGVKVADSRLALESYFLNLDSTLSLNTGGSLVIDGTLTLTNCYLESVDQDESDLKSNTFTFKFIKSL